MTVKVGLIGAGPWAQIFHVPMLSAGPHITLSAVWARRLEAAKSLAEPIGATATDDLDVLLSECDAVAFAVPPNVQAQLAPIAARAGKPLLLEKPIALTLDDARRMTEAIDEAAVPTQLMLTTRYASRTRAFLAQAVDFEVIGMRVANISDAFLPGSPFRTPWRLEEGSLLDVGPHSLDLADAAAGPIESMTVTGDPRRWLSIVTRHAGGVVGEVAMSQVIPGYQVECELFGPLGRLALPTKQDGEREQVQATIAQEFAEVVRTGVSHELDVHRGLYLQELMQGR